MFLVSAVLLLLWFLVTAISWAASPAVPAPPTLSCDTAGWAAAEVLGADLALDAGEERGVALHVSSRFTNPDGLTVGHVTCDEAAAAHREQWLVIVDGASVEWAASFRSAGVPAEGIEFAPWSLRELEVGVWEVKGHAVFTENTSNGVLSDFVGKAGVVAMVRGAGDARKPRVAGDCQLAIPPFPDDGGGAYWFPIRGRVFEAADWRYWSVEGGLDYFDGTAFVRENRFGGGRALVRTVSHGVFGVLEEGCVGPALVDAR